MSELMRPALYGSYHRIVPVTPRGGAESPWDVVGPICESSDAFARDRALPPLEVDDLVALLDTGAYGAVMASNYNRRLLAPEVLVDDGALDADSPPPDDRRSAGLRSLMARGLLVVFEGLDQSGKQTQAEALRDWLVSRGRVVRLLSFPTYETPHRRRDRAGPARRARLRPRRDAAALRRQSVRVEAGDRARAGRRNGAGLRSLPGVQHRLRRSARPEPEVAVRDSGAPAAAGSHRAARHVARRVTRPQARRPRQVRAGSAASQPRARQLHPSGARARLDDARRHARPRGWSPRTRRMPCPCA